MNKETKDVIIGLIIGLLCVAGLIYFLGKLTALTTCEGSVGNSEELYYKKVWYSNRSGDWSCEVRNKTQDRINREKSVDINNFNKVLIEERNKCYNAGEDYVFEFDFFKDYNYTCSKLEYINDHFILGSEGKDGGYLKGQSSHWGIFSGGSGSIEGKFYDWVNVEVSATGLLPKMISYHLDCNNETTTNEINAKCFQWSDGCVGWEQWSKKDTSKIEYYTESDLVMYFVNNCIEG